MKRAFLSWCTSCLGCVLLVGCASTPPIYTVSLEDLEHRNYYAIREAFEHDEVPAIAVSGEAGRVVIVEVRRQGDGKLVKEQPFYIKQGELKWIYWEDLPPGGYDAFLVVNDETNGVARFSRAFPPEDKRQ